MDAKKTLNALPRYILRSPLHRLMSDRYMLLSFLGRRSGHTYTTPVAYLRQGGTVILTTDSPWWLNLVDSPWVEVTLRGDAHAGRAEVIRATDEAVEGLSALVEALPSYGRFADVRRDDEGRANREDATRAIQNGRVLIRLELHPTDRRKDAR